MTEISPEEAHRREAESSARIADNDAARARERLNPVSLTNFVLQDIPRKEWAVEGIWPRGGKGIIAAPPKNGKSTLAIELAVSLATATPMFNVPAFKSHERAKVTYLHQGENSAARIRKDFDLILEARKLGSMEDVYDTNPDPAESKVIGERFVPSWVGERAPRIEPDLELIINPGIVLGSPGGPGKTGPLKDRRYLEQYAVNRDYLILDPIYMLAGISTNDEPAVIDLLNWITGAVHEKGCAVIFTHQSSIKRDQTGPANVMGSTFIPAWYEAALFPKRDPKTGIFTIEVDNLREMGDYDELTLAGLGTGRWFYSPDAQDAHDAQGRAAPGVTKKQVRIDLMKSMLEQDSRLTNEQLAQAIGVSTRSIRNYKQEAGLAS